MPAEVIAADYTESQQRLWPLYEQLVAKAGGEAAVDSQLKPTATLETMHTMLAHLENRYGGVRPYLAAAEMTEADIGRLVSHLRSS